MYFQETEPVDSAEPTLWLGTHILASVLLPRTFVYIAPVSLDFKTLRGTTTTTTTTMPYHSDLCRVQLQLMRPHVWNPYYSRILVVFSWMFLPMRPRSLCRASFDQLEQWLCALHFTFYELPHLRIGLLAFYHPKTALPHRRTLCVFTAWTI